MAPSCSSAKFCSRTGTVAAIDGLVPADDAVSDELWWALRGQLKLAGSSLPSLSFDFTAAAGEGLTHVVSLLGPTGAESTPLVSVSYDLEDLHGRQAPSDDVVEWDRITAAAAAIRQLLDRGNGVLVHCLGGTGRTGTVIGAVLGSYGMDLESVACWLDAVHQARGEPGWPECEWQRSALRVLQSR